MTTAPLPNALISGAVALGIATLLSGCRKPPTLTVTEPQNNYSIKASTIDIKGRVIPAQSTILISANETDENGYRVIPDNVGYFVGHVQLPIAGDNQITITANDGYETARVSLTVIRILTDEEKAADARTKAAEANAEAKAEAEAKAQEAAYSKTRAGRLCAKHPDWTRDDCERVANRKIWIGMTLEMLKANRGLPDHANPSNYGNGTSWQWCWDDYTPSCFYGEGDGIITGYN